MNDLIERFKVNAPRREETKTVTIDNYGNAEEYTIMPIAFIDNLQTQASLKFENDGDKRATVLMGDVAGRNILRNVAKYTVEFAQITEKMLRNAGAESMDEFIQGVLSDDALNALHNEITSFTVEIREARETEIAEATDAATD